jgi:putative transcriptional regulator
MELRTPPTRLKPNAGERGVLRSGTTLDVRALRERMRLTQREFAGWFGFPLGTLKHWERGSRRPTGTALVLLSVIHENPRVVLRAVRKARKRRPGMLPDIAPLKSYRAPPGYGEGTYVWRDDWMDPEG